LHANYLSHSEDGLATFKKRTRKEDVPFNFYTDNLKKKSSKYYTSKILELKYMVLEPTPHLTSKP